MRSISLGRFFLRHSFCVTLLAIGACNAIGGIQDPILDNTVGKGGTGGAGGIGGAGGTGGGGVCKPGETTVCYSGPVGTQNIGNCKQGTSTCLPDRTGFGACEGETLPASMEDCALVGDEDCDGLSDNYPICPCMFGAMVECDSGKLGVCAKGKGVCGNDGTVATCEPLVTASFDQCATPVDEDCDGTPAPPCTGLPEAAFLPPGATVGDLDDRILAVAVAADGGYFVAGVKNGHSVPSADYDAGDLYVARIGPDGKTPTWEQTYASSISGVARSIAVDGAGDLLVVGYFDGTLNLGAAGSLVGLGGQDVFIVKLDGSSGAVKWKKQIGAGGAQAPYDVDVDVNGNVFVVGFFDDTAMASVDFGDGVPVLPTKEDGFVMSLDPAGSFRWVRPVKGTAIQRCRGVAVMSDGDVVVVGDSSSSYSVAGQSRLNGGASDLMAFRLSGVGNHVWSRQLGMDNSQFGRSVVAEPNGNVLVSGNFRSTVDFGGGVKTGAATNSAFVVELGDQSGSYIRDTIAGGVDASTGIDIALDPTGDVLVTGWMFGVIDFGGPPSDFTGSIDAYVAKLAGSDLKPRWIRVLGGVNDQNGLAVATDTQARVVVGGWFTSEILLGVSLAKGTSTGGEDMFAARLAP